MNLRKLFCTFRWWVLALILASSLPLSLPASVVHADPLFSFSDDFSSDTGMWDYSGFAYPGHWGEGAVFTAERDVSQAHVVLTPNEYQLAGLTWCKSTYTSPFTANFSYLAGGGSGADGLVMMFYHEKPPYVWSGGCLSFIGAGYGIEFDEYWNDNDYSDYGGPNINDPTGAPHIAIIKDNPSNHLAYVEDLRIGDNAWHSVSVVTDWSSITVYMDSDEVLRWDGTLDRTHGGLGFAGATGGYTNQHLIDDFSIASGSPADTTPPAVVLDLRALDLTAKGFVYPTGKSPDGQYWYYTDNHSLGCAHYRQFTTPPDWKWGWLARDKYYGWTQKYHIAQDIPAKVGEPVYAIADGYIVHVSTGGWGDGNVSIFVKHTLDTGETFLAVYGHVRDYKAVGTLGDRWPNVKTPVPVKAGEPFAKVGPWCVGGDCWDAHLHFGIHPGEAMPTYEDKLNDRDDIGWGMIGLNHWPNTYGWKDPIEWITTKKPQTPVGPAACVLLNWTAPADDGSDASSGAASRYDIRYSTRPIVTEADWSSAVQCVGEPTPSNPGATERFVVSSLWPATGYYFALKTYDEAEKPSQLSNKLWAITAGTMFYLCSPADIIVTDPDGLSISKEHNEIPGASYNETDFDVDGDGHPDDVVCIPDQKVGDYIIAVVPEPGASPTDTYTLAVAVAGKTSVLADSVQISDTPIFPYVLRLNGNEAVPWVGPITTPLDPIPVGTTINATAAFSGPSVFDTHTAVWDWGDGTTSGGIVSESNGSGTVSASHTYTAAGIYTIRLAVTDDDGAWGQSIFQYVVVYDPSAGFVTGGGWINSPLGAYATDPSVIGKATFGFVAKYQKGANMPTGQTQFQFHAAGLDFKSTSYQWLVISGAKAKYKGWGTINGSGEYGFMLSAVDGQISGGGGVDKFRIKIWDKATGEVIYDNQMGASDDAVATTAISGGSIVIHAAKSVSTAGVGSIPYLGYILAGLLGCFVIAAGVFTFYIWGRPLPTRN
jgi:murein DD-endopeptidase MepM/ murein hydrolase activator NlpD